MKLRYLALIAAPLMLGGMTSCQKQDQKAENNRQTMDQQMNNHQQNGNGQGYRSSDNYNNNSQNNQNMQMQNQDNRENSNQPRHGAYRAPGRR